MALLVFAQMQPSDEAKRQILMGKGYDLKSVHSGNHKVVVLDTFNCH